MGLCAHDPAATIEKPTERSGLGDQRRLEPVARSRRRTLRRREDLVGPPRPTDRGRLRQARAAASPGNALRDKAVVRREPRVLNAAPMPPADPTSAGGRTRRRLRAKRQDRDACFASASGSPPDDGSGARNGRISGLRRRRTSAAAQPTRRPRRSTRQDDSSWCNQAVSTHRVGRRTTAWFGTKQSGSAVVGLLLGRPEAAARAAMRGDPDGISGVDNAAPRREAQVADNASVRLLDPKRRHRSKRESRSSVGILLVGRISARVTSARQLLRRVRMRHSRARPI